MTVTEQIDKFAKFAAGFHACRGAKMRKEIRNHLRFRRFPAWRAWIRACIKMARVHDKEFAAITADMSPEVWESRP